MQDQIIAGPTVLRFASTAFAVVGPERTRPLVGEQRIQSLVGGEDDVTAVASVSARRSAVRAIFFTQESAATVPTVAGCDRDEGFVYELHRND
jgi:hypothetical protein